MTNKYNTYSIYWKEVRNLISNQELMSYVRNSYNEYRNNEVEFDNDVDSIIERRCNGEDFRHTRRSNSVLSDNGRTVY